MNLPPTAAPRHDRLDALRGLAIVWMMAYHFAFDLNHFGLLQPRQQFNHDLMWVLQRTAIVSLFLFCAGLGQSLSLAAGQGWPRFWRRWGQVAGCAVAVSIASAIVFPRSWIHFGVLHGMAVMLLIARLAAPLKGGLWLAGAAAIVLPRIVQLPALDGPWGNWTGLVTRKPVTEDYVPLLPWLGVMLWGLAAGQWLQRARPAWLATPLPAACRPLQLLGRWPLTVYMLHQPLFFGVLMGWGALRG